MTKNMARANTHTPMAMSIMVSGKMECDKEKGNIPTKKTKECKYKKLLSYNDLVLFNLNFNYI